MAYEEKWMEEFDIKLREVFNTARDEDEEEVRDEIITNGIEELITIIKSSK